MWYRVRVAIQREVRAAQEPYPCPTPHHATPCHTPHDALDSKATLTLTLTPTLTRYTTPWNRAPEMLDLHRGHTIGLAVDVWALGCLLFSLAYCRHSK